MPLFMAGVGLAIRALAQDSTRQALLPSMRCRDARATRSRPARARFIPRKARPDMQPRHPSFYKLWPWSIVAAAGLWAAAAYGYLLFRADQGIELSDSSFYLLNNLYGSQIAIELRQFGVIWQALVGISHIETGRIVNISLHFLITLWASAWILTSAAHRSATPPSRRFLLALGLALAPTSAIFFENHLVDFSYNSASYLFFAAILACIFRLARSGLARPPKLADWRALTTAAVLGFAFFGMGLVKPQTALACALVFLVLFLLIERKHWPAKDLAILVLGFGLGCLLFLALLARVVSPTALAEHMSDGYTGLKLLGAQKANLGTEGQKLLHFGDKLASAPLIFVGKAPLVALPSLGLLLSVVFHARLGHWLGKTRVNLAQIGLLALLSLSLLQLGVEDTPRIYAFAYLCLLAFWAAHLSMLPAGQRAVFLLWLLPALGGFAFLLFMSTNGWYGAHHRYISFSLIATAALIPLLPAERRFASVAALLALVLLYTLPTLERHEERPYRLGAPLSQASVRVDFGPELGALRLPPRLAQSYETLSDLQRELGSIPLDQRPSLIDMTGRAPGFALYLGLRPPATSWIASGYPGSDAFLAYTLEKMSDHAVAQAYIVAAPKAQDNSAHLSPEVLNARLAPLGLVFPDDYNVVGRSENLYKKQPVVFYRPRPAR